MDYADRYLLVRNIAAGLDYPSVYMGGPSPNNIRMAERIVANLLGEYAVTPGEQAIKDAAMVRTWLAPDGTRKDGGE